MASKKGVITTAIILGAITAASFAVWMIPQNTSQTITVSDFGNHLEGVQNIHRVLSQELDDSFMQLQNGDITAEEYVRTAETASTQINAQIIQLVESQASEEWHESYINYIDALKTQNSIIRETIVAADTIENKGQEGLDEAISRIESLKDEMDSRIQAAVQNTP